jgi:hypothetical protein
MYRNVTTRLGGLERLSQEPAGKTVLTRNKHIVLSLARGGGGGGHELPQKEREIEIEIVWYTYQFIVNYFLADMTP